MAVGSRRCAVGHGGCRVWWLVVEGAANCRHAVLLWQCSIVLSHTHTNSKRQPNGAACTQMPAAHLDFTTFTWAATLKRMRQMLATGAPMWHVHWGSGGADEADCDLLTLHGNIGVSTAHAASSTAWCSPRRVV